MQAETDIGGFMHGLHHLLVSAWELKLGDYAFASRWNGRFDSWETMATQNIAKSIPKSLRRDIADVVTPKWLWRNDIAVELEGLLFDDRRSDPKIFNGKLQRESIIVERAATHPDEHWSNT